MDKDGQQKRVSGGYTIFPKTDVRYWRDRVFKPVSVRDGGDTRIAGEHFAVKLQSGKKRMTLSLHTANREEAAQLARRMYADLMNGGWALLLQKHRAKPEVAKKKDSLTFGEYIALVRSKNLIPERTIDSYVPRLRRIISEIKGIKPTRKRFAAKNGAWREEVDAVTLDSITPDDVRLWKSRRLAKAKGNDALRRKYTVSVNSTLRQARSLFGKKILKELPEVRRPHPFEDVEFAPRVDTKFYGCGIDAPSLMRRAIDELGGERREECKAFLLGIALGLRRKECDHLMWSSFDFAAGTVQVQPTEFYALKTRESAATLQLDPEITALFKGWHAQRKGNFVIESDQPARDVDYQHYRADHVFNSLVDWLRVQGIDADKPFHTLRKMFGSLIVQQHGIFAASSALRHTSLELTNAFYVDRTVRTTAGLGSILSGAKVVDLAAPDSSDKKVA